MRIEAYAAEYFNGLETLSHKPRGRTLALFLGSNISNFEPDEAGAFLLAMRAMLRAGDALLLGADLKKDRAVLESAYNDAHGVTAAFSRNILARINRELGGNFDLRSFRHRALFNEEQSRIEIHLESTQAQVVEIDKLDLQVQFVAGELIHAENFKVRFGRHHTNGSAERLQCERTWRTNSGGSAATYSAPFAHNFRAGQR